jgi:hypothetical protein
MNSCNLFVKLLIPERRAETVDDCSIAGIENVS